MTFEDDKKFEPLIVRVWDVVPAVCDAGDSPVILGTGFDPVVEDEPLPGPGPPQPPSPRQIKTIVDQMTSLNLSAAPARPIDARETVPRGEGLLSFASTIR